MEQLLQRVRAIRLRLLCILAVQRCPLQLQPTQPTALTDFADTTWSSSSITARGALIYNSSTTAGSANRAVAILDFGADKTSTSGDFTVQFPAADSSNAIIRIA